MRVERQLPLCSGAVNLDPMGWWLELTGQHSGVVVILLPCARVF